ncbi:MAG: PAS domain S-box protein, partial [Candidatus Delongbacteria bacterium]|nr:PAS domain S-box protein [Candidatus Delongbacteria bacterium]
MKNKISITKLYFLTLVLLSFLTISVAGYLSISKQYSNFNKKSEKTRREYIEDQKHIVKHEVDRALDYIESRKAKLKTSEEELKKEVLGFFSKIRFPNRGNERGILFVRSYEGVVLMCSSIPELIGKNISDKADPDGIITHDQFMKVINDPTGGFAEYSWYNPFTKKVGQKLSYVRGIPEWHWYVGASIWYDDINNVIGQMESRMQQSVNDSVVTIVLTLLGVFVFITIFSFMLSRKIRNNFNVFSTFFNRAAEKSAKIDVNNILFSEFEKLVIPANLMIEEREKTEKELSLRENKYRALFEDAGDCILISDIDGNIVDFNKHAYEDYGYTKDEFSKLNISDIGITESKERINFHLRKIKATGSDRFEVQHKKKNGEIIDVAISTKKIVIDNKTFIQSIYKNIDDYEKLKQKFTKEEKFTINLNETAGAIILSLGVDEKILSFNKFAEILTGYKKHEVIGGNWFEIFIPERDKDKIPGVFLDVLKGMDKYSSYENPILCKDGSENIISWKNSLIYDENDCITGLLCIGYDVTEQRKTEEKYQQLYDKSPDMYVSASAETGKIIECNNTLLEKTGYDRGDIIGKMILEMYHEDSLEKAKEVFEEFIAGNKITNKNLVLKKKDGEKIHVNLNVEAIKDETGKVIHSISSWRDIGELVAYDNALKDSEDLLNSTQKLTKVGGWKWNVEDQTMYWTDETYRIHEIDPIEIKTGSKKHIERGLKCYDEKDQKIILEAFNKCVNEGISYDMEFPFTTCKNNRIWVRTIGKAQKENGKVISVTGNIMDITDLKKTDQIITTQSQVAKNMAEGSYIVGMDDVIIRWTSSRFENMFGYEPGEIIGRHASIVNAPNDLTPLEKADNIMEIIRNTGEWHGEVRNIKKDGTHFWCSASVSTFTHLEYGEVLLAVHTDITKKKQLQLELFTEKDKLSTIFNTMTDGVYIVDKDYNIDYVNPALQKGFGDPEGKKCYEYFHGTDKECDFCKNEEVLNGNTVRWEWESERNHKIYDLIDTPIRNIDNSISKLEIFRDITDFRITENKLKEHQEHLEELVKEKTDNLNIKLKELENLNKLFLNREHRIEELRNELKKHKK